MNTSVQASRPSSSKRTQYLLPLCFVQSEVLSKYPFMLTKIESNLVKAVKRTTNHKRKVPKPHIRKPQCHICKIRNLRQVFVNRKHGTKSDNAFVFKFAFPLTLCKIKLYKSFIKSNYIYTYSFLRVLFIFNVLFLIGTV